MSARADLLADGGAGAAADDFFRSPEFCAAEGVTHTLVIESGPRRSGAGEMAAPLLVRDIPGSDRQDAISPYGYPGFGSARDSGAPKNDGPGREATEPDESADREAAIDPAAVDWSATGLVTIFIRHRLGTAPPLAGATARNVVLISDPALPRKSRMSDRQQIRKNLRAGFELEIVPGPESSAEQRAAFLAAYTETMHRTSAAPRYFFSAAYFDAILASAATWLFLLKEPGGEVAAASIAARSDGMLHYYLSGTADDYLRGAPMKNIVSAMTDFAWEMELPLNLGGGIKPGDRLEEFKRGFANREEHFHTSEIVCDPAAYAELSGGREAGDFFPAYRAPA